VPSPLETPPAAVAIHVTGSEVGVIVPDVGLAAPSRITDVKQTRLATKNPPAKIQRIVFMVKNESDAASSVAASLCRRVFAFSPRSQSCTSDFRPLWPLAAIPY